MCSEESIRQLIEILVNTYEPDKLYLFGSAARGDSGPDSDLDILVIVPDDAEEDRKRSKTAYKAMRGTGIAADVLVWTVSEFEKRLHLKASFPSTVVREGRLLYAA